MREIPKPGLDHCQHGGDLGAATTDLRAESFALAKPLGLGSEAVTLLHENKLFLLQIGRDYHSLADQRVASRQDKQEFLVEPRFRTPGEDWQAEFADGLPVGVEDLPHVSPLLHRHVIPNGTYHFLELSKGTTCRRIRYRMFSQPGGLWADGTRTSPATPSTKLATPPSSNAYLESKGADPVNLDEFPNPAGQLSNACIGDAR